MARKDSIQFMTVVAVHVRFTGLVHGVMFRATLASVASENGVKGWVRNLADGSVEAILEGEERAVGHVLDWANRGPPRARVDSVKKEKVRVRNLRGFKIEG